MDREVAYHQYRKKAEDGKPPKAWDSCGKFTYEKHKDNQEYEVRRLVVLDEARSGDVSA